MQSVGIAALPNDHFVLYTKKTVMQQTSSKSLEICLTEAFLESLVPTGY